MAEHTKELLKELQALPIEEKVALSKERIIEWYEHFDGKVYVSFSGGKDSTVLLHLVRSIYPDVPAVFSDTGLEFPEIKRFVSGFDNVEIIRPKMMFNEIITQYGYPLVSKEVAEAIYYARMNKDIRRKKSTEKVSAKFQKELVGKPRDREIEARQRFSETFIKRTELCGVYQNDRSKTMDDVGCQVKTQRKHLLGQDAVPESGFSKSMFNKVKWLPLAQKAPFRISHYCCNVMKKQPFARYGTASKRKSYLGTMASESRMRRQAWVRHGCNAFDATKKVSTPMAFWTEQDVLEYILLHNLDLAEPYGDITWIKKWNGKPCEPHAKGAVLTTTGFERTGCVFCGFGIARDKGETRFQRLAKTHPRLYEYSIGGGQWIDNPDYLPDLSNEPDEIGWIPWNPERIWVPDKKGLGLGFVFDTINLIYGSEMMRYK